jgi:hypothetical protein
MLPLACAAMSSLHPEALTWAGLLMQWVQFAQTALTLPNDAEGERWRISVPSIINLQAVTFALADLDRLDAGEHALALDKSEMLIRTSQERLVEIWQANVPSQVSEIVLDAHTALRIKREQHRLVAEE